MTGKVWLVGAGPGDPGLITVRGLELLRRADAVVHDRLVSAALVEHAPSQAERYDVGKARGRQRASQAEITALLICLARSGKQVVRLKGGDPFVFGRGGEEALALEAAGVLWEVVPGISAAIAAPALARIPLTQRELAGSFAVTTGHMGLAQPGLAHADTLVVLMAVDQLENIVGTLLEQGRSRETPAALVQAASTTGQRTVRATLGTLVDAARQARIAPPATLVVGPTVALSELPLRRLVPLAAHDDREAIAAALRRMADAAYDWVLFANATGVFSTWAALETLGLDARAVRARVVCIGSKTAERARAVGWPVHRVADRASRAALVDVAIQVVAEPSRAGVTGD